jgi:ABC-type Fe3+ transport system permease subunit
MLDANVRGWSIGGIVATAWIHVMAGSGMSALILYWGVTRWPTKLLQAARLEVPRWTAWRAIGWPLISPAIVAAGCWSGLLVVTDMTVADLYAQRTLPDVVYQQFAIAPTLLPATIGSAIALSLTLSAIVYWRSQRIWVQPVQEESTRTNDYRDGGTGSTWGGTSTVLICGTVLGLPLLGLLVKAGWQVDLLESGIRARFSVAQAAETIFDAFPRFRHEFYWTGLLAGLVSLIAVPVGYLFSRLRWFKVIGLGLAIGASVPAPVTALLVVWWFSQGWVPMGQALYERSLVPTVLATLPKPLAATTAIFYMGQQMFPATMVEAARMDTASRWQIFWYIELPWLKGPLILATLLSILLSMADLTAGLLVAPPEVQTVTVRMFGLLHSGVRLQEAGLCLATLCIQGLLLLAAWSLSRAYAKPS